MTEKPCEGSFNKTVSNYLYERAHERQAAGMLVTFPKVFAPSRLTIILCQKKLPCSKKTIKISHAPLLLIGFMHNYVTTEPPLHEVFSNLWHLRAVFTWVFFSSLLLWKFVRDKIYNLHFQPCKLLQLNQTTQMPKFCKISNIRR